uniref:TM2 domain containing 3 n=1 Tax=Naja naja TaxID=35670 RepID=A0A8C6VM81_NAJNA
MAAVGLSALRALKRLCCVAVFLSQLYVLSGRGSLSLEHSHSQASLSKMAGLPSSTHIPASKVPEGTSIPAYVTRCPSNGICSRLPPECMTCKTNYSCVYGRSVSFECEAKPQVHCIDQNNTQKTFLINMTCQFCWQLPPSNYLCSNPTNCKTVSCPQERYGQLHRERPHPLPRKSHFSQDALLQLDWRLQMVNSLGFKHHTWRLWGGPVLPGTVAGGAGQALQFWRPGNLDADRCAPDWSWVRGSHRRFALHLSSEANHQADHPEKFTDRTGMIYLESLAHPFLMYSICTRPAFILSLSAGTDDVP